MTSPKRLWKRRLVKQFAEDSQVLKCCDKRWRLVAPFEKGLLNIFLHMHKLVQIERQLVDEINRFQEQEACGSESIRIANWLRREFFKNKVSISPSSRLFVLKTSLIWVLTARWWRHQSVFENALGNKCRLKVASEGSKVWKRCDKR